MVAYGQGFGRYAGLKCWFVEGAAGFSMRQRLIDFAFSTANRRRRDGTNFSVRALNTCPRRRMALATNDRRIGKICTVEAMTAGRW